MSLHLGFHWSMMMGMAKKLTKKPSALRTWILRIIAVLIAGYGVYAFVKRDIGSYMLLRNLPLQSNQSGQKANEFTK